MKKIRIAGIFLFLFSSLSAQDSREIDYIRAYAKIAVEEMELYKIPASITLSQGILETGGGQSRLADIANNHFGIKCKKEWTGKTISHTDDAPNECFRVYNSVQESYRDHSKFLTERPYYKDLFKLNLLDYKGWAYGLKKSGYATNPQYADILISRIEKYKLNEFDGLKPDEVEKKLKELYGPSDIQLLSGLSETAGNVKETIAAIVPDPVSGAIENAIENTVENPVKKIEYEKRSGNPMLRIKKHPNGQDYIVVYEGETLAQIAKIYDISLKKLASYNELPEAGKLTPGQFLFFTKKKNKGVENQYKVQPGDNIYLIAQKTGIKIKKLYKYNHLKAGQQPKTGSILNLR
jgi:LysM repeat protein